MELVLLLLMVFITTLIIFINARGHIKREEFVGLVGGLFIPVFLLVIYGIGGILLSLEDVNSYQMYYGVNFSKTDIVFIFFIIIIVMAVYYWTFRFTYLKKNIYTFENTSSAQYVESGIKIALVALLILDTYTRLYEIKTGMYFDWMIIHTFEKYGGKRSILSIFQIVWSPLIAVLLYYFSKKKYIWKYILYLYLPVVFMEGDRSSFFLVICSLLFAHMHITRKNATTMGWVKKIIFLCVIIFTVSPIITNIRSDFKKDIRLILKTPQVLPKKLVFEYLPNALSIQRIFNEKERYQGGGTGIIQRIKGWPAYLASINSRYRDGYKSIPVKHFFRSLSMPVPSLLWPGKKPIVMSGDIAGGHFRLGKKYRQHIFDPASTVFADLYAYTGFLGPIFLAAFIGFCNGMMALYLVSKWKSIGALLFLGLIETMIVAHNSFAFSLVNLRNQILMLIILSSIIYFQKVVRHTNRYNNKAV